MSSRSAQQHFRHLDSLRAVAALAVFSYHCHTEFHIQGARILQPILYKGNLGVILFYLLSGFVIFGSLDRLSQGLSSNSQNLLCKQFWVRRLRRIYPLYLVSIIVMICLDSAVRTSMDAGNLFAHIFGVHSFFRDYHGAINGVLWTLSLELQFYFFAPLLFVFMSKTKDSVVVVGSLLLWISGYFLTRYGLIETFAFWGTGGPERVDSWSYFIGLNQLPNVLVFFLLGYLAFSRRKEVLNYLWLLVPLLLLGASFYEYSLAASIAPVCDSYCFNYARQLVYAFGFYIVIRALTPTSYDLRFPRFFEAPFEWLGTISFGIYIWHLVIIRFYQGILPNASAPFKVFVSLCTTIVVADFSYRHIESRFIFNSSRGSDKSI